MAPDPKWLELLKASGYQTGAISIGLGVVFILVRGNPSFSLNGNVLAAIAGGSIVFGFLCLSTVLSNTVDTIIKATTPIDVLLHKKPSSYKSSAYWHFGKIADKALSYTKNRPIATWVRCYLNIVNNSDQSIFITDYEISVRPNQWDIFSKNMHISKQSKRVEYLNTPLEPRSSHDLELEFWINDTSTTGDMPITFTVTLRDQRKRPIRLKNIQAIPGKGDGPLFSP